MEIYERKNRILALLAILIMVGGAIMLIYSLPYERYTNEQEYKSRYLKLNENSSEEFYQLQDEYLTPKFKLEDYGITLVITGILLLLISLIGLGKFKTPSKKLWIIIIGVLAALTTNIGYVGGLFLEMHRESYPHWADSLAIPLMGVPFFLILSLGWIALNLIGITRDFKTNVPIFPFKFNNLNYWYLIILLLTTILTICIIITGYFWQVLSGFLWIYFYTSILLGQRRQK